MKIHFTPELRKELQKLESRDRKLKEQVEKQVSLFSLNPLHPSLRTHKLSGSMKNIWSISITKSIRMTYILEGDTAIFSDLGTHDEVYRQ